MTLEALLKYPIAFMVALAVAMFLTPLWLRLARRTGFMDYPGLRKLHHVPMPVGGGVAVALGFHAACALIFLFPWAPFTGQISIQWWYRFLPLSGGVLLLGLIDDRCGMCPAVKLGGQILLALAAYAVDIRMQNVLGFAFPEWINLIGTVLWFLIMMNAFNLIDGIDGLSAGIGVIAALGIGLSLAFRNLPGDVLLFLALAGACLGFLRYNFYPARVYLGDSGSLFVGFTLAALSISTSSKGPTLAVIGMPLLAVGVPLFDTILAVWRRSVRQILTDGEHAHAWMTAFRNGDAEHLHHRLLQGGRTHSQVALFLYGGTVLLAATGIVLSLYCDRAIGILFLAFVAGAYTVFRHLAWIELQESGRAVLRGIRRPVRRNRTLLYYLAFDLVALHLAWLAAVLLMDQLDGARDVVLKSAWVRAVSTDIAIPFVLLIFSRSYSRVWSLARVAEYARTGIALLAGIGVACGLQLVMDPWQYGPAAHVVLQYLAMAGIALPAIVGVRAALRVVQDLMQVSCPGLFQTGAEKAERAIVWGGDYETALFLSRVSFDFERKPPLRILAIFSLDTAIRGHYVQGIRVLGGVGELGHFVRTRQVDTLFLTGDVPDDVAAQLCERVRDTGIRIVFWRIVEAERQV